MEDKTQEKNNKEKGLEMNEGDECSRCLNEKDEYLDGWKRAKAELINYKKDEIKRFESVIKFGQEDIVKDLIVVLDSFELAVLSGDVKEESKGREGLFLIKQQLEAVLKKNGLEKIVISLGDEFDPAYHEAVLEVESDTASGKIVEEIEKGYLLNGKVIRSARVKIAK